MVYFCVKKIILFFLFFSYCSCSQIIIVPAKKDVLLSSGMRDKNINGKNEPLFGNGFGTRKRVKNGYVTYPAMYLFGGDEEENKDAFLLGGFDFSSINGEIKHASLKFFINYVSNTRNNLCVFVRPVKRSWDEKEISYNNIFTKNGGLTSFVESNDNQCLLIVLNVIRNEIGNLERIPFLSAKKEVSIDITNIVRKWIKNPSENYGLLIDPMSRNDPRYCTTNNYNEIADFGIIEIATTEWYEWNGKVPVDFGSKEVEWINIENKAMGKIKYIPRLEIRISR